MANGRKPLSDDQKLLRDTYQPDNLDIITENEVPASFSSIVREFSRTVGLHYDTDCHNERRRILARSTRRLMSKGLEISHYQGGLGTFTR